MLSVTDLHTYYGDSHVLQGVSLHVARGTVVAVLGRNGVGKTTLCRSIAGFAPARSGHVVFDGVEISRSTPHEIYRRHLTVVPQGRRIFSSLTVAENLLIAQQKIAVGQALKPAVPGEPTAPAPSAPASLAEAWSLRRVHDLFPRLRERSHHRGHELSGGEQQMLAVARALVGNPILLLMDEPTEGLAPALVAEVGDIIRRLRNEGTSVLLVEQNAAFAVNLADNVYVMSQGRIVHESEPAALWDDEDVKTRFLGVPKRTP